MTEGVFAAHFISSKNGKAAAGEKAPAAVPPAMMPVIEPSA
ncbi:MAG: hypothetical protein ACLT79_07925 [Faecalibacterium prausnitzii]